MAGILSRETRQHDGSLGLGRRRGSRYRPSDSSPHSPAVPVVRIDVPQRGQEASLSALTLALHIVGYAGMARNVDLGRPHVPLFGRRIYGLRALLGILSGKPQGIPSRSRSSASRGCRLRCSQSAVTSTTGSVPTHRSYAAWNARHSERLSLTTMERFATARIGIAGLDGRPRAATTPTRSGRCNRGIATGRGKSVRAALQGGLAEELWPRVFIGHDSGAECARLDDGACPDADAPPCAALAPVARRLEADPYVRQHASCSCRQWQITVTPTSPITVPSIWDIVQHAVAATAQAGVKVVRSSHSMDVLAPGVSKRSLTRLFRRQKGERVLSSVSGIAVDGRETMELLGGPCHRAWTRCRQIERPAGIWRQRDIVVYKQPLPISWHRTQRMAYFMSQFAT